MKRQQHPQTSGFHQLYLSVKMLRQMIILCLDSVKGRYSERRAIDRRGCLDWGLLCLNKSKIDSQTNNLLIICGPFFLGCCSPSMQQPLPLTDIYCWPVITHEQRLTNVPK